MCGNAAAAAAARFLPVPLLDDVVRRRAAQVAVVRTLRGHGREHPTELLEALWDDPEGTRRGLRAAERGPEAPDAGTPAGGALADGAARVTEVLRRPEMSSLLDRFDAQVEERLAGWTKPGVQTSSWRAASSR